MNFVDGVLSPEEPGPWIQDALNQIEFLTGSTDTEYGAIRASLGYTEPWNVRYVQIGNEDNLTGGLESYEEYRLEMFFDAIKAKYPDMVILASTSEFTMNLTIPDVGGDVHRYTVPDGFVGSDQFGFFDNIKHQTLVGEIACVYPNNENGSSPSFEGYVEYPFWIGSVAEAVFLLGAERNSDRVIGVAYAPLLSHAEGSQWTPALLSFDADPSRTTRSTSYHVYRLLGSHVATETLPSKSDTGFDPLYYVTGRNSEKDSFIFKGAVYNSTEDVPISMKFEGVQEGAGAQLTVLTSQDPMASNVIGGEEIVVTTRTAINAGADGAFRFSLPNLSVAVLETWTSRLSLGQAI